MPILGVVASGMSGHLWAPSSSDYQSISTATVTSGGTASITFSSIPATFTHLQIRSIQRATAGAGSYSDESALTFNADSASNYARHNLYGNETAPGSSAAASTTQISLAYAPRSGVTASIFGAGIIDIFDYTSTNKYKTVRSLTGSDHSGTGAIILESGVWMKSPIVAITSITITAYNTAFAEFSSFALYGVK